MEEIKENDFPVVGRLSVCGSCKREILVETALFGIDHTLGMNAVCWECLTQEQQNEAKKRYRLKNDEKL